MEATSSRKKWRTFGTVSMGCLPASSYPGVGGAATCVPLLFSSTLMGLPFHFVWTNVELQGNGSIT